MRSVKLILIFILSIYSKTQSQCPSPQQFGAQWVTGDFGVSGVNNATQCTNRPVVVSTPSKVSNARYIYDYKVRADTAKATTAKSHVYTVPGYYYIVQLGTVAGKPSFQCGLFEVLATPKPTFSISSCDGTTAKLSITTANLDFDQYLIDWGDGKPAQSFPKSQNTPSHTYASLGTFNIKVTGSVNGGDCTGISDPQSFTATAPTPKIPAFLTAEVKDELSAELGYRSLQGNLIPPLNQQIVPATALVPLAGVMPIANGPNWKVVINGLQTSQQMYCYTFRESKPCGGVMINTVSNEICTLPLTITAQPYQNILNWKSYPSATFKQYIIKRDNVVIANISTNSTVSYTDTKVLCGQSYQYQVVAETSEITSASALKIVKTEPNGPATTLNKVYTSVVNDKATITILNAPIDIANLKNYSIKTQNKTFNTTVIPYSDSTSKPSSAAFCYEVNYTDVCDRTPATPASICTVFLQIEDEKLTWTADSPFTSAVKNYEVEKINEQGTVLKLYSVGLGRDWPVDVNETDKDLFYRIKATNTDGKISYSNVLYYSRTVKILVPDVFSPNNDKFNDTFEIKGQFIEKGTVTIFDRWGIVLYYTDDLRKGWDGTDTKGQKVSEGCYGYSIQYSDAKKNSYRRAGSVCVLK